MTQSERTDNRESRHFPEQIKAATRLKHQALDHAVPLMQDNLSEEDLSAYLRRVAVFHWSYETHLETYHPGQLNSWNFNLRMPLLLHDLQLLGSNFHAPEHPLPFHTLNFNSKPILAGWQYVIDGSALGGTVIYRHLSKRLSQSLIADLTFFRPYGDNPINHWRSVQDKLITVASSEPQAPETIISAANMAFDWYLKVITE